MADTAPTLQQPEAAPDPDGEQMHAPPAHGDTVHLFERYLIDTRKPYPDLDTPTAKAYFAEDRRNPSQKLYALVCNPRLVFRSKIARVLRNLELPGIVPLIEFGSVDWPPANGHATVVIYPRPLGGKATTAIETETFKFTEYTFPKKVMGPILEGLISLNSCGLTHRAIRPDNLYFMDEDCTTLVLGDCVTAPPGFSQPFMFESVHTAMAHPAGRGDGDVADDIFAFGVTCVRIFLGYNPVEKAAAEEFYYQRIENSSYSAICGSERIPLLLIEPVRGMLNDVEEDRWNLERLESWLDGRKQPLVQKTRRAAGRHAHQVPQPQPFQRADAGPFLFPGYRSRRRHHPRRSFPAMAAAQPERR